MDNIPTAAPVEVSITPSKNNNMALLVGVLLLGLILILLAIFYYYGSTKSSDASGKKVAPTSLVTPTSEETEGYAEDTPAVEETQADEEISWTTESVKLSNIRASESGSPTEAILNFERPQEWSFEADLTGDDCGQVLLIDSQELFSMSMGIVCGDWSSDYIDWPGNAVIVDTKDDRGNDVHTSYLLRYTGDDEKTFLYTEASIAKGEKLEIGVNTTTIDNAIFVSFPNGEYDWYFKPIVLSVEYYGKTEDLDEMLNVSDRIAKSLTLNESN